MKKFSSFIIEKELTPDQQSRLDALKDMLSKMDYPDYV